MPRGPRARPACRPRSRPRPSCGCARSSAAPRPPTPGRQQHRIVRFSIVRSAAHRPLPWAFMTWNRAARSRAACGLVVSAALALAAPSPVSAQAATPPAPKPAAPAKPAVPAKPGQPGPAPRPDSAADRVARATAAAAKAMKDYRASLDRLLAVYESDLARATELVQERTAAVARGAAPLSDVEEAELLRQTAEENVVEVRAWIEEADRLQREVSLSEYIARLPALRPGTLQ